MSFAEIDKMSVIGEIVAMREDLVPDVSLGTHFFSEMVECGLLYFALFPNQPDTRFDPARLENQENRLAAWLPETQALEPLLHILEFPPPTATLHADALEHHVLVHCPA